MKRAVEEGVVREAQAQARVLAEEARCGISSRRLCMLGASALML
jgi:hypothetical protein